MIHPIKGKSKNQKEPTQYRALEPTECQLGLPDKSRRNVNYRFSYPLAARFRFTPSKSRAESKSAKSDEMVPYDEIDDM